MTKHADLGKSQVKSKIVVHRRINKTFAANTPEQSVEKAPAKQEQQAPRIGGGPKQGQPQVRQRDKLPQSRGESPLMNDLNWYLQNKDQDFTTGSQIVQQALAGKGAAGMHLIGINPPPSVDEKIKLAKIKPSMSRERVGINANQLLINLQNYNFKQQIAGSHKRHLSDLNQ